jgi:hypothetical protein
MEEANWKAKIKKWRWGIDATNATPEDLDDYV